MNHLNMKFTKSRGIDAKHAQFGEGKMLKWTFAKRTKKKKVKNKLRCNKTIKKNKILDYDDASNKIYSTCIENCSLTRQTTNTDMIICSYPHTSTNSVIRSQSSPEVSKSMEIIKHHENSTCSEQIIARSLISDTFLTRPNMMKRQSCQEEHVSYRNMDIDLK